MLVRSYPQIVSCWPCWAQVGSSWLQVGSMLAHVGSCCPQVGPQMAHVGPFEKLQNARAISGGPKWLPKASPKTFQSVPEESPRLRWRAHGFPRRRQGWTKHPQRLCLEGLGLPRFPQRLCLRRSDDRLFRWAVPSSCFRPERLFLFGASFGSFCHDGSFKTIYSNVPLK